MTEHTNKPPVWFWIIATILLLWGLMGLFVYYDFVTSTPETMAQYVDSGAYTQAYVDYLTATPAWSTAVFALAVFSGALGALLLVLCKKWALPLYGFSLLMIVVSLGKSFIIDKAQTIMTGGQIGMEVVVFLLGVLGIWFARMARNKGWLI